MFEKIEKVVNKINNKFEEYKENMKKLNEDMALDKNDINKIDVAMGQKNIILLNLYTNMLLGKELSLKEFKEYISNNIDDIDDLINLLVFTDKESAKIARDTIANNF
jgi:uncharacterized protein YutE (UPF0331/DUF86 family)